MSESPFPKIAHPYKRAFLAAFRETGNVRLACEVVKVGRSSHYRWLEVFVFLDRTVRGRGVVGG